MGPEPRDFASPRDLRRRALVVLVASWLVGSAAMPGSLLGAGKTTCTLVPQLRDVTINQGVGSYARLVRGKETLVRLYLSLPSCASSTQSIALTDAKLTVTVLGINQTLTATPAPASPFPTLAPYTAAAALDAPADPRFVIPGSLLAPGGTVDSYDLTLSATIKYTAKISATSSTTGSVTFTTFPGTSTPLGRTVEKKTNALRVLAVPMGDASKSYASQFSTAAQSALETGMLTLSRIYPVPDGTGDLAGTTGGVRYTILPTLLDIGSLLGSDGKFCGGGATFDTIKGQLAQFLLSWNSANPSATADRVVGVVDQAISNGSSLGCADGWSAIGTSGSWVRAITSESPGRTGALLAMEIGHSLGLVPTSRDHTFDPYHSPYQEADGGTNRGYDIRTHLFIADDRTSMRGTGTWNNATTLLEPIDYAFLLCMLGGSITTDCSAPSSVGTSTGVAAGPKFVISGTTNGIDAAGTSVVESYFAFNVAVTEPPASSEYFLRQLNAGTVLRDDPIAVETVESVHGGDSDSATMLFAAVVNFDTNADRIELRRSGVGDPLYFRDRGAPPVIQTSQALSGGEQNYTDDIVLDDTWPMVSPNGAWVAWTQDDGELSSIVVAPIGDAGAAVALSSVGNDSQPAWNPDGDELAFVRDGDVVIVALDLSSSEPFGAETVVYDADPIEPGGAPDAGHPSWSPDGTQIAFDANGAIFVVDALEGFPEPEQLTFTGDASHPNWSWTLGDNRIAYQRDIPEPIFLAGDITLASYVEPPVDGPIGLATHAGTQFTVNSADDAPSDGICDAAHCNLREAINAANALAGKDSIHFSIGTGAVALQPASDLPTITSPVVIDGTTQPGWTSAPIVELDGQDLISTGLDIAAGTSDVIGLVVNRFTTGIRLTTSGGNTIRGSYIGTDATGTTARPNANEGVLIESSNNTVGGTTAADRNVVSGNDTTGNTAGIRIISSGSADVIGNYIGTTASGMGGLQNSTGVWITSAGNTIGGYTAQERNVISGNDVLNIFIAGTGATGNHVIGNYIGPAADGMTALGNAGAGIRNRSPNNFIGEDLAGAGNVISGNAGSGIDLAGDAGSQPTGNIIQRNLIGVAADGTTAMPNTGNGIGMSHGNNDIGGAPEDGNVIANNTGAGVVVGGGTGSFILGNSIYANGGLGIDLSPPFGLTANDVDDVDTGSNDLQNFPVLTSADYDGTNVTLDGTLNSGPNTTYTIEVFNNSACNTVNGYGEGKTLVHSATTATDGAGDATFSFPFSGAVTGNILTATATDPSGNTSEFSQCRTVTGVAPPADADLAISQVDDPDPVVVGQQLTYTLTITNLGPADATGVTVGDIIPAAVTQLSVTPSQGSCAGTGSISCDLGALASDASATVAIDVRPTESGSIINAASVTADQADPVSANNSSNETTTVLPGSVVNSTADPGTGGCNATECTLREAITAANGTVGTTETIIFDIPDSTDTAPHTISLLSPLPPVIDAVVIDGTSEPDWAVGAPVIELDGNALTADNQHGLFVTAGPTTIRGLVIRGFGGAGIYVCGAGTTACGSGVSGGADGNLIEGNFIGTNATGTAADGNLSGILLYGSSNNTVGGTTAAARNVISGSTSPTHYGIGIFGGPDGPMTANVVQGNLIGVAADGATALANAGDGVVMNGVSGSLVGGTGAGEGNVIANSGGTGVLAVDNSQNAILGNSIYANGSLGIDLGGGGSIAENDYLDPDTGPNDLQNYPDVTVSGDGQTIYGTLLTEASQAYRIELFRNSACDDSGADTDGRYHGEGQEYLGFVDVTTNADGYVAFTFNASADPILLTEVVTATATDASNNTSEFSACAAPTPTGTQVWTLDPAAPSTTQEALVADAAQPAFGAEGRVAFVRDDSIFSINADGTGLEQLTDPGEGLYDSMPSLGGIPAFVRFFDNFDGGGQFDVFLLHDQAQVVTTVTDDNPEDLRLDIYYQCLGSPAYDVAVGLPPDSFDATSASWITNYDPSLACPDGTLTAIASDGFLRSTSENAGAIESEPQAPVPTVYGPLEGQEFLQYQAISLHGGAKDAEDGEVSDLEWFLDGTSVGTGGSLILEPPTGGWPLGTHEVRLVATDSDTTAVRASVMITILGDADNDGLSTDVESETCFPLGGDSDPTNAFADYDSDGYSNVDDVHTDGGPCVAATSYGAIIEISPDPLLLPSPPRQLTVTVNLRYRDLGQINAKNVRILEIANQDVSADPRFVATTWRVRDGVATATFDVKAVMIHLFLRGIADEQVSFTIGGNTPAGVTPAWSFEGTDSIYVSSGTR